MRLSDFNNNKTEKVEENVTEKNIMDKYNQYKDLSSDQLSQELFKEVSRQKTNGTFDYQRLESMLDSIKGSLSDENYQNMKRILETLR